MLAVMLQVLMAVTAPSTDTLQLGRSPLSPPSSTWSKLTAHRVSAPAESPACVTDQVDDSSRHCKTPTVSVLR
jgi:hypothetical protein